MNAVLNSISYIFHPLFMPLLGTVFYFTKSPRFIPEGIFEAKLFALGLLTVLLPVLLFFLLKTLKKIESEHLKSTKERILPLIIYCVIITLIIYRVFPSNEFIEMYYFFVGVLGSTLACLILALLNYKASIHMIGVSGFFFFIIALSIHFNKNFTGSIALMSIICGAVATSRLHQRAHTITELFIGTFIGIIPQLILVNYWL